MAELTPMKRQYQEIKQQHTDCLLFFRVGDFYEMFNEDAVTASRELDLALTTRDRNIEDPDERTPMCGVPYHSAEGYIAKLIQKGYKVAICEQMEDPALAKGLVQRDVIRIITPGTVTDSAMLQEERSNYICAIDLAGDAAGIAFCELSTGEFCCAAFPKKGEEHVRNELARFQPREAVLSSAAAEMPTSLPSCASSWAPCRKWAPHRLNSCPAPHGSASSSALQILMKPAFRTAAARSVPAAPSCSTCRRPRNLTFRTSTVWTSFSAADIWNWTIPHGAAWN